MLPQNYHHRFTPDDHNHFARRQLVISLAQGMKHWRAKMVAARGGSGAVRQVFT